ncbi:MAG: hypothetical protein KME09_16375 [Pleurocapsa minor HA4230-MV1]|jgi:hypothetical protein|nr:hypothetical protein [Pleurocapsa minor HA4230-MV1]
MADLTLAQRFGSSVALNATTKVLSIDLNNLTTITIAGVNYGLNISALTDANKNDYASKILWSLLLLSQANQPADNNDETVKLYMTNQGKRNITRNSVNQFGYQLLTTAYQNDSLGVTLDPDNIS